MYTVYAHRNLKNGKYYVGMTSQNPMKRWNNGWGYKKNSKMLSDIQNSDWNKDWEHNIIGQFENKQEALNIEETFIRLFDSINEGYNISSYGSGNYERTEEHKKKISEALSGEKAYWYGKHLSEEHKKKLSEAQTGHEVSEETKKKISESMTGITFSEEHKKKISEALSGEKAYWYGKHHSEESKKKISEAHTGEKAYWYGKHHSEEAKRKISESMGVNGIIQYSKDGKFIAEYPSIMEASRQTGCNQGHICECCKGNRKSAGGFIWRYK